MYDFFVTAMILIPTYYKQIRIETDPADRTQLRMTVASGDPALTFEYVYLSSCTQLPLETIWRLMLSFMPSY